MLYTYIKWRYNEPTSTVRQIKKVIIMNKSQLFKNAHKLVKRVIKAGDSYSATFSISLKIVYAESLNNVRVKKVSCPTDFIMNHMLYAIEDFQDEIVGNDASNVLIPFNCFKESLPVMFHTKATFEAVLTPHIDEMVKNGLIGLNKVRGAQGYFILKPVSL